VKEYFERILKTNVKSDCFCLCYLWCGFVF